MYVLDSSAIIEAVDDEKQAEKIARVTKDEPVVTTTICIHEILAGTITERDRFVLGKILSGMQILEHTVKSAHIGAQIQKDLEHVGKMINPYDILIAAVCKENNAELITFDKGFARVKGLTAHIFQ